MTAALVLTAPVAGWLMPLDDVPDAAFAARMVGEGAAIDPTGSVLRAPCDGVVTMLADTRHAVTVRSDCGADVLLHVGIDTVRLAGEGLVARTRRGARVSRGEPLLEMDLDRLARGAASLITPIVVMDGQRYRVTPLAGEGLVAADDAVLEIAIAEAGASASGPAASAPDASGRVVVRLEHGFHARPAARLARVCRRFRSRVVVSAHGRETEAASTVGLMALGVRCGDDVMLAGHGPDAEDAVRTLIEEIESGAGEAPVAPAAPRVRPGKAAAGAVRELRGVTASPGLALGVARHFQVAETAVAERGAGTDRELAALEQARAAVRADLESVAAMDGGDMLAAQAEFLDDPELVDGARALINEGKSAAFAWRYVLRDASERLRALGDPRLAERAADLRDVEIQVLQRLAGCEPDAPPLPDSAIVLATELLPSQLARLDLAKVAGFCSAAGGATSHVALLATSLGIPAVVGAGRELLGVPDGARVLLDADRARLVVEPEQDAAARAEQRIASRRSRLERYRREAAAECRTADGRRIEVFANVASLAEAENAVRHGAEGCGLLRTEFLFQHRAAAPTADEQAAEYQAIANALSPRPLVIRLLDAGGDKPIPYLRLPPEDNPLLGLRGLRVSFRFPALLREQLAAILRVEASEPCRILLPMVTEPAEVRRVREAIAEAAEHRDGRRVLVGAMIETPASVALAAAIAREADFLSIGSNDLAQYTLAIDRAHRELGRALDHLHPAVLRQIRAVVEAAGDRCVSVCGALASDSRAVPLLIGLGVRTLSAASTAVPEVKALVRTLTEAECREVAAAALDESDAAAVRRLIGSAGFAERLA